MRQWRLEGGARAKSFTVRMLTPPQESAEKVRSWLASTPKDDGKNSVDSIPLPRGSSADLRYYRDGLKLERVVAARTRIAADPPRSAYLAAEWVAVPRDGVVFLGRTPLAQFTFLSGISPAQFYDDAVEAALGGWEAAKERVQDALAQPPRAPARISGPLGDSRGAPNAGARCPRAAPAAGAERSFAECSAGCRTQPSDPAGRSATPSLTIRAPTSAATGSGCQNSCMFTAPRFERRGRRTGARGRAPRHALRAQPRRCAEARRPRRKLCDSESHNSCPRQCSQGFRVPEFVHFRRSTV